MEASALPDDDLDDIFLSLVVWLLKKKSAKKKEKERKNPSAPFFFSGERLCDMKWNQEHKNCMAKMRRIIYL